jgi:ribosomal protein S11
MTKKEFLKINIRTEINSNTYKDNSKNKSSAELKNKKDLSRRLNNNYFKPGQKKSLKFKNKKLYKTKKLTRLKFYCLSAGSKKKKISGLRKTLLFLKKLYTVKLKTEIQNTLLSKRRLLKKVNIRIAQNNIFCTFTDLKNKKILHTSSSGVYKIKISKRKLKYLYSPFISLFFKKIKKNTKNLSNTFFNIIAPSRLRKKILKQVSTIIKEFNFLSLKKQKKKAKRYKNVVINIDTKKCFNGCRAPKGIRKKRNFYRIYK